MLTLETLWIDSLLQSNDAVYASMMVGICRIAKSDWLSSLNHLKVCKGCELWLCESIMVFLRFFQCMLRTTVMQNFFYLPKKKLRSSVNFMAEYVTHLHIPYLFTVCPKLSVELLQPHYNGYAATCNSGFVKLYNPYSVVSALEVNKISDFWAETGKTNKTRRRSKLMNHVGQYSPLSQSLWRGSPKFRDKLDLLVTQKSVTLEIDEYVNYSKYLTLLLSIAWLA